MFDIQAVAILGVFVAIMVLAARAGAASVDSFVNMFGVQHQLPRPRGTQETDLAPFAFR